ncbi:unnamed protein product [Tenebrio molitor]|nr:unnamed protein product [Tenebrio molitor]
MCRITKKRSRSLMTFWYSSDFNKLTSSSSSYSAVK